MPFRNPIADFKLLKMCLHTLHLIQGGMFFVFFSGRDMLSFPILRCIGVVSCSHHIHTAELNSCKSFDHSCLFTC